MNMSKIDLTESQIGTYEFIKKFISTHHFSPTTAEIAAGLNLKSRSAIHRNLQAIEKQGLISLLANRRRNIRLNEEAANDDLLLLVGRIAAGKPIEVFPDNEQKRMDLNAILASQKNLFLLEVKGDSMSGDNICEGDLVICEKTNMLKKKGQIAVVIVNKSEATLKRVMKGEEGKVILIPSNPHLSPMEYESDEVEIQGVYVGLLRLGNLKY
jgi:repressor LexA